MKKIILVIILIISAFLFAGCNEQKNAHVEFKQNVLKEEFIEETIIEEQFIEETKLYENVITWDNNAQVKTWD